LERWKQHKRTQNKTSLAHTHTYKPNEEINKNKDRQDCCKAQADWSPHSICGSARKPAGRMEGSLPLVVTLGHLGMHQGGRGASITGMLGPGQKSFWDNYNSPAFQKRASLNLDNLGLATRSLSGSEYDHAPGARGVHSSWLPPGWPQGLCM
jgi:hypothetical protein